MPTRREFLTTAAALATAFPACSPGEPVVVARNPFTGTIGLQLWSLREYLPNDLAGTLSQVRTMGFTEVEGAGLWGHTATELRAAMDAAGLRCQSVHMGLERLRDDLSGALQEAEALGATWVVCPWIQETVSREDILRAAEVFNLAAPLAAQGGFRFAYHCHGYEFVPSPDGTLFDTLVEATLPSVEFQIDVFHAYYGGADPAALIAQLGQRATSLHLKDLKPGVSVTPGTATGTPDIDVPVGTGQIDMVGVLRAAVSAGTLLYYIEDESADPLTNIPLSLDYVQSVDLG